MKSYLAAGLRHTWKWIWHWVCLKPHFLVGNPLDPYLKRWYVIPRNPILCIYLHQFLKDDEDRAEHDHPWDSVSLCIKGTYTEIRKGQATPCRFFSLIYRKAENSHRIVLPEKDGKKTPAWTLFITGWRKREWGFHCPSGWVHWKDFTKPNHPGQTGKGCDQ